MARALVMMATIMVRVTMFSERGMGRWRMYSMSGGSLPKAMAARVSMARLMRSSWMTVMTTGTPQRGPRAQMRTAATLTVSWKTRNLRMLRNMVRP